MFYIQTEYPIQKTGSTSYKEIDFVLLADNNIVNMKERENIDGYLDFARKLSQSFQSLSEHWENAGGTGNQE